MSPETNSVLYGHSRFVTSAPISIFKLFGDFGLKEQSSEDRIVIFYHAAKRLSIQPSTNSMGLNSMRKATSMAADDLRPSNFIIDGLWNNKRKSDY